MLETSRTVIPLDHIYLFTINITNVFHTGICIPQKIHKHYFVVFHSVLDVYEAVLSTRGNMPSLSHQPVKPRKDNM